MKKFGIFCLVGLGNIGLNFAVFIFNYNKLATPYLNEDQRMLNAQYIMTISISEIVLVSVFTLVVIYLLKQKLI